MMRDKVLILADKEDRVCCAVLEQLNEHFVVHSLGCGTSIIEQSGTDLVIMDCGMLAEEGLRQLRHMKLQRPEVPVIFITDASSEEVAISAFKAGARGYFKKPFDRTEFTIFVKKILALKRGTAENNGLPAAAQTPGDIPERLSRVIRYIDQNITKPIELDMVAQVACWSKFHFSRAFKKHIGLTPIQFILNRRINHAIIMMRNTDFPISTVAVRAGFNDLSSFNKHFKKIAGLTPSEYRKSIDKSGCCRDAHVTGV